MKRWVLQSSANSTAALSPPCHRARRRAFRSARFSVPLASSASTRIWVATSPFTAALGRRPRLALEGLVFVRAADGRSSLPVAAGVGLFVGIVAAPADAAGAVGAVPGTGGAAALAAAAGAAAVPAAGAAAADGCAGAGALAAVRRCLLAFLSTAALAALRAFARSATRSSVCGIFTGRRLLRAVSSARFASSVSSRTISCIQNMNFSAM